MDARDERFEERLQSLGAALDGKVGPSDPELLGRLLGLRGGAASKGRTRRAAPHGQRRWYYWAAVLLAILVAVPYVAHLAGRPQQTTHHPRRETVLRRTGSGKPIVLGSIEAVDFVTPKAGWVAAATGAYGSRNAVLETSDGGRTWVERMLPQGYTALAIHVAGDRQGTGYVLAQRTGLGQTGAAGQTVPVAILTTQDGGRTWHVAWSEQGPQALDNATVLMRVGFQFFGGQGYAYVGDRILTSQDGVKAWSALSLPQGFEPVHMDFLTPRVGFVAGQTCQSPPQAGTSGGAGCQAELIATTDGGQSWQTSFRAPQATYWNYSDAVSFATAEDGWFFLKDGASFQSYLYETTDGGQTWTLEQPSFAQGRTVYGPPTFVTPQVGWLPVNTGAAPYPGGLLITSDGGKTWTQVGSDRNWSLNGISLLSPKVGYAAGSGGSAQAGFLVKTTDGGRSWTQILPSLTPTAQVDFATATQGFGVGVTSDPQAILRTTDGGATWREVARAPGQVQAISFVDQRLGYMLTTTASGQSVALRRTTDGGSRWQVVSELPALSGALVGPNQYLHFFGSRQGIVQTETYPDVVLEATSDGGRSWTKIHEQPAVSGTVQQFAFTSLTDGYMLTTVPAANASQPSTVTLAATTDGGGHFRTVQTWQGSGQGAGLYFLSPDQGWVAMQRNPYSENASTEVLATRDGGRTWAPSTTPMTLENSYTSLILQFPTARDGWLMGLTSLYRTRDGGQTWQAMP